MGMLNRLATAVTRETTQFQYRQTVRLAGTVRKGTVYHPVSHRIVGFNFGTSVRPDVAPITVNTLGTETVESFLARGGRIVKTAPKSARGVSSALIRVRPTHVRTSRG